MSTREYLLAVGVMTGNSLDGADTVLTRFDRDGNIEDLVSHSLGLPDQLKGRLREVRDAIESAQGVMADAIKSFDRKAANDCFADVQADFVRFVHQAVSQLLEKAKAGDLSRSYDLNDIDVIGFHGQTCAHQPPSILADGDTNVYTCQIGDGQLLADLAGITVVHDFRSDDIMNGGEGAPLAPVHHEHIARKARKDGMFPLAFCNAGNTGNVSIISEDTDSGGTSVLGWDTGPFNNYPDKILQKEKGIPFDRDGQIGKQGKVDTTLLSLLFEKAVRTANGNNYLLKSPPKSSDPQWYRMLPELSGDAQVGGAMLSLADRVRTAEYFAAYVFVYGLSQVPDNIKLPANYALCGGGWKNPVAAGHFRGLLDGDFDSNPILSEHQDVFEGIQARLRDTGKELLVEESSRFGFDGGAMEARLFADAAVSRIIALPFTKSTTSGARGDTICGIIRFPDRDISRASSTVRAWLEKHKSLNATTDSAVFDSRWSRASAGWQSHLAEKSS